MPEPKTDKQPAFEFQLDLIKRELDILNSCIDKIDTVTQGFKNWTILLWSGSVILAFGKDATEFQGKYLLTAIIPLLFWVLDAWWRRIQREFIFRNNKISDFFNSPDFTRSFEQKEIIGLRMYDLRGSKSGDKQHYEKFTSLKRAFLFKTVGVFYLGLILISCSLFVYMKFFK
jgi:hypothetical protein